MTEPNSSNPSLRPRVAGPVERFLGPAHAFGGPFGLLQVAPAGLNDEIILEALDRQIDRVAQHPERDTPEADEVRLALHAAAAQLLDPIVRHHLVARWGTQAPRIVPRVDTPHAVAPSKPPVPAPPPVPASVLPPAASALPAPGYALDDASRAAARRPLERDAMLVMGMSGGWNARALQRLIAMARSRGLATEDVVIVLQSLSNRAASRAAPAPRRRGASPAPQSTPDAPPRAPAFLPDTNHETISAERALRRLLLAGAFAAILLVAGALSIIWFGVHHTMPNGIPNPVPDEQSAPHAPPTAAAAREEKPASTSEQEHAGAAPAAPAHDPADLVGLSRQVRAAAEAVGIDSARAGAQFREAVDELSRSWPKLPADQLIAANDAIVEYLYRAGNDPRTLASAVESIASPADVFARSDPLEAKQVLPAAWSSGILARLSREKDLPPMVRERLQASPVLRSPIAPTELSFEAGRAAAMGALPARMLARDSDPTHPSAASLDAWRAWMLAVDGISIDSPPARSRFILNAIETLLIEAREPDRDRSVLVAVSELVTRLSWRADENSRPALLRWFADQRVSAADLRVVTGVIATRSGAEGIDATMVLSTNADAGDREALRGRYAAAWGIADEVNRDRARQTWAEAARAALTEVASATSDEDRMRAAARLAALHESASWIFRGVSAEGLAVLDRVPTQSGAGTAAVQAPVDTSLSDGAWAEKYLGSRSGSKERRDMLTQLLGPRVALGPIDAEVVVSEWGTSASADVRNLTTQIIRQCADQESMINAMLERLPRVPATSASQSLLELLGAQPLPPPRDPQWKIAARRALVERLLDLRGPAAGRDTIDRLAESLALSYRGIAADAPLTREQRAARPIPAAQESAALAFLRLRTQTDRMIPASPPPMTTTDIERARAARQSQARGPIQAFAAQQSSLAELIAYAAHAEQPSQASAVRETLETLRSQRRAAKSVFEQLAETEAAIVKLWLIRLEVAPA